MAGMQEDEEVGGEGTWGDLVQPRYRRMMVLAVSLPLLQQASGINSITFYSSSVSPTLSTWLTCRHFLGCAMNTTMFNTFRQNLTHVFSHARYELYQTFRDLS